MATLPSTTSRIVSKIYILHAFFNGSSPIFLRSIQSQEDTDMHQDSDGGKKVVNG